MIGRATCAALALAAVLALVSAPPPAQAAGDLADALTARFGETWHPAAPLLEHGAGRALRFKEGGETAGNAPAPTPAPSAGQKLLQANDGVVGTGTAPASRTVDRSMEVKTLQQELPDESDQAVAPSPTAPDPSEPESGTPKADRQAEKVPDDAIVDKATRPMRVGATLAVRIRSPAEAKAEAIRLSKEAAEETRRKAAINNQTRVVETVDINRLRLECPRMPCPQKSRCAYKNGVCCANGGHCCPSGSTCINTDPPTCTSETLDQSAPCAEGPCSSGYECPHKGVYLCCKGGRTCCAMGFACDEDGQCLKQDAGDDLQRRFEDMLQAKAALKPKNYDERHKVRRTPRQAQALASRLGPSESPVIRIVTMKNTLPAGYGPFESSSSSSNASASSNSSSASGASGSAGDSASASSSGGASSSSGGGDGGDDDDDDDDSSSSSSSGSDSSGGSGSDSSSGGPSGDSSDVADDDDSSDSGAPEGETAAARKIRLQVEAEARAKKEAAETEARTEEGRGKRAQAKQRQQAQAKAASQVKAAQRASKARAAKAAEAAKADDVEDARNKAEQTAKALKKQGGQ